MWWHLWDLWHWCKWWFSSSLTKIPHNVGFLAGWIQHCEEFFKNFSIPPGKKSNIVRNFSFDTTSNNWKNVRGGVNKNVPTLRGIFQKLFQSCIARNFEMKSEIVFQIFLTKLDFGNLWSFWWHLWYLWHWCQWWFGSSLQKIPHDVGFLPG